jgi:hypothetical protein
VKVALGLPLSWLVSRSDREWPWWLALGSDMVYPRSNFKTAKTISCSISNERAWWALSRSITILTLWRHLMTQWRKILCKTILFNALVHTWVNTCSNGGPESMHAQMEEPGSMHAWMGEGFCKILLALWATWFIILQKLAFCKICYSVCLFVCLGFFCLFLSM